VNLSEFHNLEDTVVTKDDHTSLLSSINDLKPLKSLVNKHSDLCEEFEGLTAFTKDIKDQINNIGYTIGTKNF
jgi:hypothetical protein